MEGYLRIGTNYYKKVNKPQLHGGTQAVIIPWNRQTIVDDHGKSSLEEINKYEGFTVIPSHLNYEQEIDEFYNLYAPLSHNLNAEYLPGSTEATMEFLTHIFGDQLEVGLDYLTILWQKPPQILPILCLVSTERNTGKTTFLNWLKLIFEDNMTINTNDDFRSRFNSDWAIGKLLIAVDEVLLDKREDSERLKNLSTAKSFKSEAKGKDKFEAPFFGHFILCSNNEHNFIFIDEKEIRYWIRKIPVLQTVDSEFELKLIKELPNFIAFISSRKIISKKKTRMWFTKEQIRTDALNKLKKGTQRSLEIELLETLQDMFVKFDVEQISFTAQEIQEIFRKNGLRITKQQIAHICEHQWGLIKENSSYKTHIITKNFKGEDIVGIETKKGRFFTVKKEDIGDKLNC